MNADPQLAFSSPPLSPVCVVSLTGSSFWGNYLSLLIDVGRSVLVTSRAIRWSGDLGLYTVERAANQHAFHPPVSRLWVSHDLLPLLLPCWIIP